MLLRLRVIVLRRDISVFLLRECVKIKHFCLFSTLDGVSDGWSQHRGAINGHSQGPEEEQTLDLQQQMKDDTPVNPYDSGTEGSEPTNPYPACNGTVEKEPSPPSPVVTDGNGPLICGMVESQCPRVQDQESPAAELNGSGSVEGPKAEMGLTMEVDPSAQAATEEESLKDGQCGALAGGSPLCLLLTNSPPSSLSLFLSVCFPRESLTLSAELESLTAWFCGAE